MKEMLLDVNCFRVRLTKCLFQALQQSVWIHCS